MLEGGAASRQDTRVTSSTGSEMKGWGPQLGPWRLRETGSGSHCRLRVGNRIHRRDGMPPRKEEQRAAGNAEGQLTNWKGCEQA